MLLSWTPLMHKISLEQWCSCWKVECILTDWCKCRKNVTRQGYLVCKIALLYLIQYAVLQVSCVMHKVVLFNFNPSNVANDCLILFLVTKGEVTSSITKCRESYESETKPKPKTGKGRGGLFDGDDEDDLFSGTTSKPSPAPATQGMSFVRKHQCILQYSLHRLVMWCVMVHKEVCVHITALKMLLLCGKTPQPSFCTCACDQWHLLGVSWHWYDRDPFSNVSTLDSVFKWMHLQWKFYCFGVDDSHRHVKKYKQVYSNQDTCGQGFGVCC